MRSFIAKSVLAGVAAFTATLTAGAMPGAAQGWRDGPSWDDEYGAWRPRPRMERYRDRYEFDPYQERRARPGWRWEERGWTRDGEDADDRGAGQGSTARRPPAPARDDDADWQQDEDAASGKAAGVDGGGRPYIAPRAPSITAFAGGGAYKPGSIVIDTSARRLYYVRNAMSAYVYPIGVGRDGFSWTGKEKVSRIADWPDWYPPTDMRQRKPELPERMLGGLRNPLGAKAIYLGNTLYRIHGTNDPKSIGKAESSGCFRMMNEHVLHLASIVSIGTEVTVVRSLRQGAPQTVSSVPRPTPAARVTRANSDPRVRWSADPDRDYTDPEEYR